MSLRFFLARRLFPRPWAASVLEEGTCPIEAVLDDLAGRRVALVGNARALAESGQGGAIDGHDLVIRMNRAPGLGTGGAGHRLDWLATSIPPGDLPAARVIWMTDRRRKLPAALWRSGRLTFYPTGWRAELAGLLGARPSTGAMALDLLHRSRAAEIELYGFDFFASRSASSTVTAADVPHDFAAEAGRAAALAAEDGRIRLVPPGLSLQPPGNP